MESTAYYGDSADITEGPGIGLTSGGGDIGFSGDFYRGDGQVYRGMTMGTADLQQPSLFEGEMFCGVLDKSDMMFDGGACPSLWGPSSFTASKQNAEIERFQDGDVPPNVPSDAFFQFEVTTLFAECKSPSDLGNGIVELFSSQVVSNVKKVRRLKFAIKADVFVNCIMCTIKVRVYSLGNDKHAIEFQRRHGSHTTFFEVYETAKAHFQTRFTLFGGAPTVRDDRLMRLMPLPCSLTDTAVLPRGEIQPLLDMAGRVETPSLQAEAAAALVEIVRDPNSAESLCTPGAFAELQKLLQADGLEILYSVGCLLVALADLPKAEQYFASGSLLTAMLAKIRSQALEDLARSQLAQALRVAVCRCASAMDGAAAKELSTGLVEAVKETSLCADDPIHRNLHEARYQLMMQTMGQ